MSGSVDLFSGDPSLTTHGIENVDRIAVNPNEPQCVGAILFCHLCQAAYASFGDGLE